MPDPAKEAQETLVKIFRDLYFKAGASLKHPEELQLRSTIDKMITSIRDAVIAQMPQAPPQPPQAAAGGNGDAFPHREVGPAAPAAPPAPPKRGFFGNILKSEVVPDPHRKKK